MGLEHGIAEDLVAAGIPRDHIVLAFRPPDLRIPGWAERGQILGLMHRGG